MGAAIRQELDVLAELAYQGLRQQGGIDWFRSPSG